jgi:hypothetical protein
MNEQIFWIVLTCILTPVSSLLCCWLGVLLQDFLGLDY